MFLLLDRFQLGSHHISQAGITYPITPSLVNVGFLYVNPEEFEAPRPRPSITSASTQEVLDLVKGWEEGLVEVLEVR